MAQRQDLARLDAALDALPIELRECLVFCEMEQLSYKEIAQITQVPIGTVHVKTMARATSADAASGRGEFPMTTEGCAEVRYLLQADFDGELDVAGTALLAAHRRAIVRTVRPSRRR